MTLRVDSLSLELGGAVRVPRFDLTLGRGEVCALVGPSGSGKTLAARAVLGLQPSGAHLTGSVTFDGRQVVRGRDVSLMPQEPWAALNPVFTVGQQLLECVRPPTRLEEALAEVSLDPALAGRYPHQLSGGQRQRVALALALASRPEVLIADEPTTALDAPLKIELMELLLRLVKERGLALWLNTHDPSIIPTSATVVPLGAQRPEASVGVEPPIEQPERGAPLLVASDLCVTYGRTRALEGVALTLHAGERVGVIGHSGSGKSTLLRALAGLEGAGRASAVRFHGQPVHALPPPLRRKLQLLFQDAGASLDPRWSVRETLLEAAPALPRLADFGLDEALLGRLPSELSSGQKQRVAFARASSMGPEVLLLDEFTASVDLRQRDELFEVLRRTSSGISWVVASHDLHVIRALSHRVVVLDGGKVVEEGPTEAVLRAPAHPVTAALVAASTWRAP